MITLKLKQQRSGPFWKGECLVFSGALSPKQKEPNDIQLVLVAELNGTVLGSGMYNPHSSYRVRLLDHGKTPLTDLSEILNKRIQEAINDRKSLDLPSEHTNAFRLINSEGDSLSGLTIDHYADHLVVVITAAWAMQSQALIEEILKTRLPNKQIHWRPHASSLKQEGWIMDPNANPSKTSEPSKLIQILENNLIYQIDIHRGQKTGFYCDQRDNRLALREISKNCHVLDTCSYTGGFALNAALGGARSVLGIDSSDAALNLARTNLEINNLKNNLDKNLISFEKHDMEEFLSDPKNLNKYNLIILDPPKFAPSKEKIYPAKRRYLKINRLALIALAPQSKLITCSCSDAFTQEDFQETLELAAQQAGRKISIEKMTGAAPDHKLQKGARFGAYLKVFWLNVE